MLINHLKIEGGGPKQQQTLCDDLQGWQTKRMVKQYLLTKQFNLMLILEVQRKIKPNPNLKRKLVKHQRLNLQRKQKPKAKAKLQPKSKPKLKPKPNPKFQPPNPR